MEKVDASRRMNLSSRVDNTDQPADGEVISSVVLTGAGAAWMSFEKVAAATLAEIMPPSFMMTFQMSKSALDFMVLLLLGRNGVLNEQGGRAVER